MKEINSIFIANDSPDYLEAVRKRVFACYGYCSITELSGELKEGIYMATFSDDYRILFEDNDGQLNLLLTKTQAYEWDEELRDDSRQQILEEILTFYHKYKAERRRL